MFNEIKYYIFISYSEYNIMHNPIWKKNQSTFFLSFIFPTNALENYDLNFDVNPELAELEKYGYMLTACHFLSIAVFTFVMSNNDGWWHFSRTYMVCQFNMTWPTKHYCDEHWEY